MERKKWTIDKPPTGYPRKCKRNDLSDAIEDFSDELVQKSVIDDKDFFNRGWKERCLAFIQLGQSELQRRNNNYVLIISMISLAIALIALFLKVN